MDIHLISDTHIEFGTSKMPKPWSDVCVLAGDIGLINRPEAYYKFLAQIKRQFDHVILVLGNHEFYSMNYFDGLAEIKEIADTAGVHLMDIHYGTDNLEIDGVTFWGSTLWTDFKKYNQSVKQYVGAGLNDFHVIDGFTTDMAYNIHMNTVEKINWNADVIVTHHMPILREHTKFGISDISYGFCCTDLEKKIATSKVKYWMYGHTHDNVANKINNTSIITNQTGYGMERLTTVYNPDLLITI